MYQCILPKNVPMYIPFKLGWHLGPATWILLKKFDNCSCLTHCGRKYLFEFQRKKFLRMKPFQQCQCCLIILSGINLTLHILGMIFQVAKFFVHKLSAEAAKPFSWAAMAAKNKASVPPTSVQIVAPPSMQTGPAVMKLPSRKPKPCPDNIQSCKWKIILSEICPQINSKQKSPYVQLLFLDYTQWHQYLVKFQRKRNVLWWKTFAAVSVLSDNLSGINLTHP